MTDENFSPQEALARLAARRAAKSKGPQKSVAQLCRQREGASKGKKKFVKKVHDGPKGNQDAWAISH